VHLSGTIGCGVGVAVAVAVALPGLLSEELKRTPSLFAQAMKANAKATHAPGSERVLIVMS
jgi:hypothetical protein